MREREREREREKDRQTDMERQIKGNIKGQRYFTVSMKCNYDYQILIEVILRYNIFEYLSLYTISLPVEKACM